jgi:hypothetical protein
MICKFDLYCRNEGNNRTFPNKSGQPADLYTNLLASWGKGGGNITGTLVVDVIS